MDFFGSWTRIFKQIILNTHHLPGTYLELYQVEAFCQTLCLYLSSGHVASSQKCPTLGWMLCCCCLESLSAFWARGPAFSCSCAPGSAHSVAGPACLWLSLWRWLWLGRFWLDPTILENTWSLTKERCSCFHREDIITCLTIMPCHYIEFLEIFNKFLPWNHDIDTWYWLWITHLTSSKRYTF